MEQIATDSELAKLLHVEYNYSLRERVNLLLIDDDPDDLNLISKLSIRSNQLDFSICKTLSTLEAIDALANRPIDLIFLDYWMGSETSIAFVYSCARALDVPFVLVTGFNTPDIRRLGFRAGAEGFLTKNALTTQAIESVTLSVLSNHRSH